MTKEQKKNVRAWVRALRSGKYKQGKNYLNRDGRFCCLGVACELAVKAKVISTPEHDRLVDAMAYDSESYTLPEIVQEWLGLTSGEGDFGNEFDTTPKSLARLNDSGKRFKTIARIIESEPEGLFV